ncbi:MAG: type I restriction-modification system methyltransferase, partial [Prolixibacteraceae bacterium]
CKKFLKILWVFFFYFHAVNLIISSTCLLWISSIKEIPAKLADWYKLSYTIFIAELGKKKIKLSLADEAEWEDYFNGQKQKAQTLKSEIEKTDREIDRMVYGLYGLTEEEIKIVEDSM